MYRFPIPALIFLLLTFASCSSQEKANEQPETPTEELGPVSDKKEPHRYGGWYCPDNFGFVPVDIQKLDEIPAIAHRLPTEEELNNNMSLIRVDTAKYPDAKALEMDLPRVATVYSERKDLHELIIVIQAIIVQEDTVVGYRFVNGGNGSGWISDVNFLSDEEVASKGSQPFFYSKTVLRSNTSQIWKAIVATDYFKTLGEKFNEPEFFSSDWNPEAQAHLERNTPNERAIGYVGMVYGNYYMQIDYVRDGFHYSEKLFISENQDKGTTELHVANGPYPEGFEAEKSNWKNWVATVKKASENK